MRGASSSQKASRPASPRRLIESSRASRCSGESGVARVPTRAIAVIRSGAWRHSSKAR